MLLQLRVEMRPIEGVRYFSTVPRIPHFENSSTTLAEVRLGLLLATCWLLAT